MNIWVNVAVGVLAIALQIYFKNSNSAILLQLVTSIFSVLAQYSTQYRGPKI